MKPIHEEKYKGYRVQIYREKRLYGFKVIFPEGDKIAASEIDLPKIGAIESGKTIVDHQFMKMVSPKKGKKTKELKEKITKERYLVQMYGGLEPGLFGPYQTEKKRDQAAKHHHKEMNQDDNLFALDIEMKVNPQTGRMKIIPSAFTYSGGFFTDEEGQD